FDSLHEDLVFVLVAGCQGDNVNLHAVLPGNLGLLLGVAQVFVAVADQNNALTSPFRKRSQSQFDGGCDVRVITVDGAGGVLEFEVEAGSMARRQFQPWPQAKKDETSLIAP